MEQGPWATGSWFMCPSIPAFMGLSLSMFRVYVHGIMATVTPWEQMDSGQATIHSIVEASVSDIY